MNPQSAAPSPPDLYQTFGRSASPKSPKRRRGSPIFPIRFSAEERARLSKEAGETPLATYIKLRLFNNLPPLETFRPSRPGGRPATDTQLIAKLLAALGDARLANNLNQLARAANMGTLETGPDMERELLAACAEIHAMRRDLIAALGLKA